MRRIHSKRRKINARTMHFAKKRKDPVVILLAVFIVLLVLFLGSLAALVLLNVISIPDFL